MKKIIITVLILISIQLHSQEKRVAVPMFGLDFPVQRGIVQGLSGNSFKGNFYKDFDPIYLYYVIGKANDRSFLLYTVGLYTEIEDGKFYEPKIGINLGIAKGFIVKNQTYTLSYNTQSGIYFDILIIF